MKYGQVFYTEGEVAAMRIEYGEILKSHQKIRSAISRARNDS